MTEGNHWRIQGVCPTPNQNLLISMQFLGKSEKFAPPLPPGGLAPLPMGTLDPPLAIVSSSVSPTYIWCYGYVDLKKTFWCACTVKRVPHHDREGFNFYRFKTAPILKAP